MEQSSVTSHKFFLTRRLLAQVKRQRRSLEQTHFKSVLFKLEKSFEEKTWLLLVQLKISLFNFPMSFWPLTTPSTVSQILAWLQDTALNCFLYFSWLWSHWNNCQQFATGGHFTYSGIKILSVLQVINQTAVSCCQREALKNICLTTRRLCTFPSPTRGGERHKLSEGCFLGLSSFEGLSLLDLNKLSFLSALFETRSVNDEQTFLAESRDNKRTIFRSLNIQS